MPREYAGGALNALRQGLFANEDSCSVLLLAISEALVTRFVVGKS